jgi:hypothetical protein
LHPLDIVLIVLAIEDAERIELPIVQLDSIATVASLTSDASVRARATRTSRLSCPCTVATVARVVLRDACRRPEARRPSRTAPGARARRRDSRSRSFRGSPRRTT